ncbi:PH domain-containing protein [Longispora sp. NPDC051575]|uniref:PH domain-containing protein n=1 Tax=Longispora sp. NPDC051575 TaxID=3154943 RepID=UPI003417E924
MSQHHVDSPTRKDTTLPAIGLPLPRARPVAVPSPRRPRPAPPRTATVPEPAPAVPVAPPSRPADPEEPAMVATPPARDRSEVVARPWFARLVTRIAACALAGAAVLAGIGWDEYGQPSLSAGHLTWSATGAALAVGVGYLGARPRVQVDPGGVLVVNVVGARRLPWSEIRAVRYEGTRCARLDTVTGELVRMDAVRAVDREYADDAVHRLRQLLAAHRARGR